MWDNKDLFVSLTGTDSGGFRDHDDQSNLKLNANMGVALNDSAETRFYLSGNVIEQALPGSVSKSSALNDPESAAAFAESTDWKRDIRSLRLANKTTFALNDGGLLDIGAFVNAKDLFHPITPFVGIIDQESIDYGVFVERSGEHNLGGRENQFKLGFRTHSGHVDAKVFQNIAGSRGALTSDADQTSHNAVLYGENLFYMQPEWALVTGLQAVWSKRDYEDNINSAENDDDTFAAINPKLGVLYEPTENLQYFANVSRSYEPPTFSELTQGGTVGFTPVDAQNAWTAEIGTRGSHGMASWDISLYRAWVKDEMLQFTTGVGVPASTFNADDTIHQGVELGFALQLSDQWQWRNAYTYSDFHFDGDSQYGDNEIAGQPEHFYQTELRYTHSDGWFVAPNLELASSSYVDFANTLEASGYGIVGLNAGYAVNDRISFYLDGRNLLDKRYISTYSTTVNSFGNTAVFYPGEGRAFYAGMRVKF
ncbi:MAG: TonB-dependent receptor family protein [Rickettsiales bacterium]